MSNARNLARLLPNTSGQLPTGNIQDDAIVSTKILANSITNAKLANGYPNQDYVSPTPLGHVNFGTANTWYNMGYITIPSSGDWVISLFVRLGQNSLPGFFASALSTSGSSGNIITNKRMLVERLATVSGNGNHGIYCEWVIRFGSGCTFPNNIYALMEQSQATGTGFNTNDQNGVPTLSARKLSSTSSTASSPTQVGG